MAVYQYDYERTGGRGVMSKCQFCEQNADYEGSINWYCMHTIWMLCKKCLSKIILTKTKVTINMKSIELEGEE